MYEQIGGRVNQLQLGADGRQRGRELAGISFHVPRLIDVERDSWNCGL